MASVGKRRRADPVMDAAVEYFAARSHDAWRKQLLQTNPEQKGKPRMRLRGGVMVDVNQPWAKLHAKAKADNKRAAQDAFAAVRKFPNDREAASDYAHKAWIKRNKSDPSLPKHLFKPYSALSKVEKDKDRAHVDNMKKAIAATRKPVDKVSKAKKAKSARAIVRIDAKSWAGLQAAAKRLSAALGHEVPAEALLAVSADAMAALAKSVASDVRRKRG
ncbi:hypothetical protein DSM104635_01811 [Terricaulis silvestris]|uniref:Uncharacterized protein n=2 Tax=Terricaulis silvestris TaxID=2686094 RepID=A0A6I6MIM7_9CAUL|nr:hypothetical protein DSM104635_01811 [Terricaulis silvestris]